MRYLPFLLLAGCAQALEPADQGAALARIAGAPTGPAQACVSPGQTEAMMVIDRQTVAYRIGRTLWVNRLAAHCPSLSPTSTIILERFSTQVCRGDRIRTIEHGLSIPSGACLLGDFTPHRPL
ncbi:MAG TPA: DUF6491 family protein [Sphingomicrobium sp.]|nr:DUF6491 family protein [Sphingomicrobium sp.]